MSFGAHLLLAIFTGIILARILRQKKKAIVKVIQSTLLFITMFILQALTYTQDSGAPTLTKITNSIKATLNYNKLQLNDYLSLNTEEKIVYNSKFNKESIKDFIELENMDSKNKYFLTRIDDKLTYDKTKLVIDTTTNSHQIIEINKNGERSEHEIGNIENLLRIKHGGYKRWSIRTFDKKFEGYEKLLDKINRRKDYR